MTAARRPHDGPTPEEIKQLLLDRLDALVRELVPGAKRKGGYWMACNPVRAEKNPSFQIKPHGGWTAFNDDARGSVIQLISYVHRRPLHDHAFAMQWAKDWLQIDSMTPKERAAAAARRAEKAQAQDRKEALERGKRESRAFQLWLGATPIEIGDPADRYLLERGIDLDTLAGRAAGEGRTARHVTHWTTKTPADAAMVWPVRIDGRPRGVHMTFLRRDPATATWGKLAVPSPKLMLGSVSGGIVHISLGPSGLTPTQAAAAGRRDPVILAEGIETALSLALAVPEARVWACLSLSNIGVAPVDLPCVGEVFVALENDVKPGALAQREAALGKIEARIGRPPQTLTPPTGSDFNDVLQGDEDHGDDRG